MFDDKVNVGTDGSSGGRDDTRADRQRARALAALGDVEPHAAYGEPAEELALYGASVDLLIVARAATGHSAD